MENTTVGHTPGPWEIAPYSDRDEVLSVVADYKDLGGGKCQAHWIAECSADLDFDTDREQVLTTNEANARLIAAAPDLLAALKDAESKMFALGREFSSPRFTDRYGDGPALLDLAERARAAIAKAEGRAR